MLTLLLWLLLVAPDPTPTTKLTIGNGAASTPKISTSVSATTTVSASETAPVNTSAQSPANSRTKQATETSSTEKLSIWAMLLVIISCGLLGGAWNYLRTYETVLAAIPAGAKTIDRLKRHLQTCLLGGIVAGGIVPFLLISTSSNLLEAPSTYHYFVFGAYCLAASVSSAAFIEAAASSLVKRLQADLKQTQHTLATTTAHAVNLQMDLLQTKKALATTTVQLQSDLLQSQQQLTANAAQTAVLQDKTKKLESIATTLHGIQQLWPVDGVVPQQQYKQQMQALSDQLNAIKN